MDPGWSDSGPLFNISALRSTRNASDQMYEFDELSS